MILSPFIANRFLFSHQSRVSFLKFFLSCHAFCSFLSSFCHDLIQNLLFLLIILLFSFVHLLFPSRVLPTQECIKKGGRDEISRWWHSPLFPSNNNRSHIMTIRRDNSKRKPSKWAFVMMMQQQEECTRRVYITRETKLSLPVILSRLIHNVSSDFHEHEKRHAHRTDVLFRMKIYEEKMKGRRSIWQMLFKDRSSGKVFSFSCSSLISIASGVRVWCLFGIIIREYSRVSERRFNTTSRQDLCQSKKTVQITDTRFFERHPDWEWVRCVSVREDTLIDVSNVTPDP